MPFCGACDRLRLTSDGQLRSCLFSRTETNLRDILRSGASDDDITAKNTDAPTRLALVDSSSSSRSPRSVHNPKMSIARPAKIDIRLAGMDRPRKCPKKTDTACTAVVATVIAPSTTHQR